MELFVVPPTHIDIAWADGASALKEATDVAGGEITDSQLKMLLATGDRTLLKMVDNEQTTGWAVVKVEQLPNMRTLMVMSLVAHNGDFHNYLPLIQDMARNAGCSKVRCAAKPAQARLYRMKCGFKPVYEILEVET